MTYVSSEYNRWSYNFGEGDYSSIKGIPQDQVTFLEHDKLNEVCHNFSFVGKNIPLLITEQTTRFIMRLFIGQFLWYHQNRRVVFF